MGDFEFALVFYHRGYRLRPELQKFRLGIEKSQQAIVNCIGSKRPHAVTPAEAARWAADGRAAQPGTQGQQSLFASAVTGSVATLR